MKFKQRPRNKDTKLDAFGKCEHHTATAQLLLTQHSTDP